MRVRLSSSQVEVPLDGTADVTVAIFNDTDVIAGYRVSVLGADPSWISVTGNEVSVFPSETASITVSLTLPDDFPAGHRRMAVQVESLADLEDVETVALDVVVPRRDALNMRVEPSSITGGRRAMFGLLLENRGNDVITTTLDGADEEAIVGIDFSPHEVTLEPGQTEIVRAEATGRRPWFGTMVPRIIRFQADGVDPVPQAIATFIQRPRIGRWVMSLAGLIAAISVFAIVITNSFERVADNQRQGQALIEVALDDDPENAASVSTNPGSITGAITGAGDAPLAGVTVELFTVDDGETPVGATSSGADGSFSFPGLDAGEFKVRASGAGFSARWFGGDGFADAGIRTVALGEPTEGTDFVLEGRPGSIAGQVIADDPTGSVVVLLRDAEALQSDVDAEVGRADVGPAGEFVFEAVPSPADYVIAVVKPGFTAERRPIRLDGGEAEQGVEILLRAGNGTIAGSVVGPEGELGNVAIEATDGTNTFTTVSLTTGDFGAFALRDLPTPGTYTLTFAREGFATESLTVSLDEVVTVDDVSVRLASARGIIEGVVATSDTPITATVTVTGGGVTRSTRVRSEPVAATDTTPALSAGSYRIDALPVPATYTVTFSAPGHLSQTRTVRLASDAGLSPVADADASLTVVAAEVFGTVVDSNDQPVGGATIELGGLITYTSASADAPDLGAFRLGGITPGVYTLTVEEIGTGVRSVILEFTAGEAKDLGSISLLPQAVISGVVTDAADVEVAGATVALYLVTESGTELQPGTETTGSDGRFTFTDIDAPQTYVVVVQASDVDPTPLASRTVDLAPGLQIDDADIQLPLS